MDIYRCPYCGTDQFYFGSNPALCKKCGGAPSKQCPRCSTKQQSTHLKCQKNDCQWILVAKCPHCKLTNPPTRPTCYGCGKKILLICPFCLTSNVFGTGICVKCNTKLPVLYVDRYPSHPPFFVQVFGWPRVGKTVYLMALTFVLSKLSNAWPGFSFMPATEVAQANVVEINRSLAKGVMPPTTQKGQSSTYMAILHGMQRWGNRILVTRDCSGEAFDKFQVSTEDAPYLMAAPAVLMLVSLPDLRTGNEGKSPDMLLVSYINTLMENKHDFDRLRRLVVTLTKADIIEDLPANVHNYLDSDPIWIDISATGNATELDSAVMAQYLQDMQTASDQIWGWLRGTDPAWSNFMELAQQHNMDVKFAIISSTGGPVGPDNKLATALAPHRVLDPYFWALEFQTSS